MLARSAAFSLLAFPLATQAFAEEAPVALRYEVAATCPGVAVFERHVQRFAPRVAFGNSEESARSVRVTVSRAESRFKGEVVIGGRSARSVDGATCAELVDALALITALAIERPEPEPAVAPAASPAAEGPVSPVPPREGEIRTPATSPSTLSQPTPTPASRHGASTRVPWLVDLEAAGTVRTAIAPTLIIGATLGVVARSTSPAPVAPLVGLAASYATSGPFDGSSRLATYKLAAGQLLICPVHLAGAGPFSFYPCVTADVGVLPARGESLTLTASAQAAPLWADVAVRPRGLFRLGGPLYAVLDAGAAFSFVQPRFVFLDPTRQVRMVHPVGVVGSLGLAATLW